MLLSVFCVYDSACSTWRTPIFARNKGEMMRSFIDACNDPNAIFAKHPSDYTLFEIGTWDDDKCKFDLLKTPVSLGIAIEFVKRPDGGVASESEGKHLGSGGR